MPFITRKETLPLERDGQAGQAKKSHKIGFGWRD
jgi:hypothetical protein